MLISSVVLFLVSCREISGTLEVNQPFTAIVNKKCSWNPFKSCDPTKKVEIPAGNYNATVDFSSKTEIKIEMKANAYKETIILKRPKNFEFPQNGPFQLTQAQVNQGFDISGQVNTTVWDSPLQRQNESCSYTIQDWVCQPDGTGKPNCGYVSRSVWGQRYVEFYDRNTTREMHADLIEAQKSVARFDGSKTDSEKIYTFTSICH